ncbi:MAG: subclass B1 metallo-beta-lactamase [Clostridia bacterium]|nr:subclass B1 metallo-beta-lactamase [Clostridia bacterium]
MRKAFTILMVMISLCTTWAGCSNSPTSAMENQIKESTLKRGSEDKNYVELTKINDHLWVHTSYQDYNGSRTPSNGMVAVTSKSLVLIDTPWNTEQTKTLLELTKDTFKKDFTLAVITHAHVDRIGGINALLDRKIEVFSTKLTGELAEKNGFMKPSPGIELDEMTLDIDSMKIETFYPGEGHTADNITVWFPEDKVLFGGCLIKSADSTSIGNTQDANLKQWPMSVKKVLDGYKEAEIVVPGHGAWGDLSLIKHTLELLERNQP